MADNRRYFLRKLNIRRKEQGKLFFVPFFFNYILIPFLVYITYRKFGITDETKSVIQKFTQYFTPILATWWIFMAFIKYVDEAGNEIYFVQKPMKHKEVLGFLVCYIISNTPPFLVYGRMFSGMELEWLRIVIECALFAGIAYFLIFFIKNIAIAMVPVVGYGFMSVLIRGEISPVYCYYGQASATVTELQTKYMCLFVVAIVLFCGGILCNSRMCRYN